MKKIFKYPLEVEDKQVVMMPVDAQILCIQVQHGTPCIWALVDPALAASQERTLLTFGTGHELPTGLELSYIGTYLVHGGNLVFHVFEQL